MVWFRGKRSVVLKPNVKSTVALVPSLVLHVQPLVLAPSVKCLVSQVPRVVISCPDVECKVYGCPVGRRYSASSCPGARYSVSSCHGVRYSVSNCVGVRYSVLVVLASGIQC